MPRIAITLRHVDEIEELDEQDWELQIDRDELEDAHLGVRDRRGLRFGAAETRDRKYNERRKQVHRGGKR